MNYPYGRGLFMASPAERSGASAGNGWWEDDYLLPLEAQGIQKAVAEACDRMDYAGSPMYHEYPDRVTMERVADGICGERRKEPWYHAVVQMMLCREIRRRRNMRGF